MNLLEHLDAMGPMTADHLASLTNLGSAYQSAGDNQRAEPLLREVYFDVRLPLSRWSHPRTLNAGEHLLKLTSAPHLSPFQAADGYERRLGSGHPSTLAALNNLALLLESLGDKRGALTLLRRSLDGQRERLGSRHPDTLTAMGNMGLSLYNLVRGCRMEFRT